MRVSFWSSGQTRRPCICSGVRCSRGGVELGEARRIGRGVVGGRGGVVRVVRQLSLLWTGRIWIKLLKLNDGTVVWGTIPDLTTYPPLHFWVSQCFNLVCLWCFILTILVPKFVNPHNL